MPGSDDVPLRDILDQAQPLAFAFLLILTRVGGLVMILPFMGDGLSGRARVVFSTAVAVLLVPTVGHTISAETYALGVCALAGEATIGLWMGWIVRTLAAALSISAQYLSHVMGLSTALITDGTGQVSVLVKAFDLVIPVIFLGSSLYQYPLRALVESYEVLPAAQFFNLDNFLLGTIEIISRSSQIAVQVAAPFLVTSFAWSLASGLIARMIPRLQIYFVVAPLQAVIGLLLLGMVVSSMLISWQACWQDFAAGYGRLTW